ncbi:MAG: SAM-dependent methyltransferase [Gammaproteobacteria bacterium]|nr:SAM-dependent methyltransferase [Gammaproteobacteria bacterium]
MNRAPPQFPAPDPAALAVSRELTARIAQEIEQAGGWISFDRYMQRALYEPGLGYYSGGSTKLGAGGDFVTAPELGDALARAAATVLAPVLRGSSAPTLLELGAGSGAWAEQLIRALDAAGAGPRRCLILEPSAELRDRQRRRLAPLGSRAAWLGRLPEQAICGAIVANEVVDALPAAVFVKRAGRILPLGVRHDSQGLAWSEGPEQPELSAAVAALENKLPRPLPDGYRSEIRLGLAAWIAALGASLERGGLLLVDYGYDRKDYYRPERSSGTLMCHYRHRAHADPFLWPGLQDLTAWVDFSACADAARNAGFDVAGYTTQGQFLVEALGAGLLGRGEPTPQALSALKTLVLPGEMGERFKILWLTKGVDGLPLPGRDLRRRL